MPSRFSGVEFPYHGNSPELTPIIPIKVYHESFKRKFALQVLAKVDTGFPGAFIMSEALGKRLKEMHGIYSSATENLVVIGVLSISCEVFPLVIQLPMGRWTKVNAFLPQGSDLGNIVGMELLRTVLAHFVGDKNKLIIEPIELR